MASIYKWEAPKMASFLRRVTLRHLKAESACFPVLDNHCLHLKAIDRSGLDALISQLVTHGPKVSVVHSDGSNAAS